MAKQHSQTLNRPDDRNSDNNTVQPIASKLPASPLLQNSQAVNQPVNKPLALSEKALNRVMNESIAVTGMMEQSALYTDLVHMVERNPEFNRIFLLDPQSDLIMNGVRSFYQNGALVKKLTLLKNRLRLKYDQTLYGCLMSVQFGSALYLSEMELRDLIVAALCRDLGWLYLNPSVASCVEPDTPEAVRASHYHPALIAKGMSHASHLNKNILNIVIHHEDKVDGSGYPSGVVHLPVMTQVVGAADDVYEQRKLKGRSFNELRVWWELQETCYAPEVWRHVRSWLQTQAEQDFEYKANSYTAKCLDSLRHRVIAYYGMATALPETQSRVVGKAKLIAQHVHLISARSGLLFEQANECVDDPDSDQANWELSALVPAMEERLHYLADVFNRMKQVEKSLDPVLSRMLNETLALSSNDPQDFHPSFLP